MFCSPPYCIVRWVVASHGALERGGGAAIAVRVGYGRGWVWGVGERRCAEGKTAAGSHTIDWGSGRRVLVATILLTVRGAVVV
eukprot:COSAG02_NODE_187_length_30377_cov_3.636271_36_plen_83_part_00